MKYTSTLVLTVLLALGVGAQGVLADSAPPNVSNVQAQYVNGSLVVNWSTVTDPAGIDHYNVYFSRQSILGNSGNFDDVNRTSGSETSYTFAKPPYSGHKVYVSVMAVNKNGAESAGFESEASAEMTGATSSASSVSATTSSSSSTVYAIPTNPSSSAVSVGSFSSVSTMGSNSSTEPLALMRIRAYAETGILLEFSKSLNPSALPTTDQFLIADASGTQLNVTRIHLSGSTLLALDTAVQMPERVYVLGILQNIIADDGTSLTSPLPQMSFFGFRGLSTGVSSSTDQVSSSTSYTPPPDNTPPEDATNLRLQKSRREDGTYDVGALWNESINTAGDLANYMVYTTTDGSHFSDAIPLAPGQDRDLFGPLQPGTFGVKLTARDTSGNESAGIQKIIQLPSTGFGLFGLFAISGAVAGHRIRRKKVV